MKLKIEEAEIQTRLDRIKAYNTYHLRAGQPQHCMTEDGLQRMLKEWGADQDRAIGIGYVPEPSPILAAIRAQEENE